MYIYLSTIYLLIYSMYLSRNVITTYVWENLEVGYMQVAIILTGTYILNIFVPFYSLFLLKRTKTSIDLHFCRERESVRERESEGDPATMTQNYYTKW